MTALCRCVQVTHSHGAERGSGRGLLNEPRALVVDAAQRVWVADCRNHRIKVLGARLEVHAHKLVSTDHGLDRPTSLALDHVSGLLYVGQHDGRILVFRVQQDEP